MKPVLSEYDWQCIQSAKQMIEADIVLHYSIPEIAAEVGINDNKLKIGFKQKYNKGLYEYLKEKRLQKAAALLKENNKPIHKIAATVGYADASTFIHAFKKAYRITPAKFRKKN